MADTHPNAFRLEAADKRSAANNLLAEADQLDAQAHDLEAQLGLEHPAEEAPAKPAPKAKSVSRSSKSGKFVSNKSVKKSPATTETQKVNGSK